MIGSKFEYNDFTGFEYQPSARLWWTPNDHQTLWGSVSRAVRTPNFYEEDVSMIFSYADTGLLGGGPPSGVFIPITINGNKTVKSEELLAFEAGYRHRWENVTFDITGFANQYRNLIGVNSGFPDAFVDNLGEAESYGVEVAAEWQVMPNWRLSAAYSYLQVFVHDQMPTRVEGDTPQHLFNIRSHYDINDQLEFNTNMYFAGERKAGDAATPAFTRLDVGVTWRPTANMELSVWGQNLLDSQHGEFTDMWVSDRALETQRSVFVQLTTRF
jgi:iron complex outermembrane receptor protein